MLQKIKLWLLKFKYKYFSKPSKIRNKENFELWLLKFRCRWFNKPSVCYVAPKKMRDNQFNCAFHTRFPYEQNILDKEASEETGEPVYYKGVFIYQFDIKGDKDRTYQMTVEEFNEYWEILSYGGFTKAFSRIDKLVKDNYYNGRFIGYLYHGIRTKFNGKICHWHKK